MGQQAMECVGTLMRMLLWVGVQLHILHPSLSILPSYDVIDVQCRVWHDHSLPQNILTSLNKSVTVLTKYINDIYMAYGKRRFNAAFTRALQQSLSSITTSVNTKNLVDSAQDRNYLCVLVNAALNLRIP